MNNTKYIQSLEDFFISKHFNSSLNFQIYDTTETIYDDGIIESDVEMDIQASLDIIYQRVLSGCISAKATSIIDIKGLNYLYENYICVYNTLSGLKTICSVEYDIKDFAININTGGNIIPGKLSLKILKSTRGNVGVYPYINTIGKISPTIIHKPLLISLHGGTVQDLMDFRTCENKY